MAWVLVILLGAAPVDAATDADEVAVTAAALQSYYSLVHGGTGVAFPEERRPVLLHHATISPSREQLAARVSSPANRDAVTAYASVAAENVIRGLLNRSSRSRRVQFAPAGFVLGTAKRGECGPEYGEDAFADAVAVSRPVFPDRRSALIYVEHSGGARAYHAVLADGAWKIDWYVELWACG